jgi:class 3 adenylate cyclase
MGVLASMLSYKMGYTATNANLFIYFSITTEIFLLSIALADKQRILELDKKLAQEKTIQIQREANESLEKKVVERTLKLQETNQLLSIEKEKSEKLILNILPSRIATELKENGKVKPRIYTASILFTDFHGFTKLSENLSPKELISELDTCFRFFDTLMDKYKLEKLKTIGDSFMCAGGIPDESVEHPFEIIKASLEMRDFIFERNLTEKNKLEIRIGIHIGKVIAGVIGDKKFTYDVWGDTVNTASRMESSGEIGKVNISEELYKIIKDEFDCMYRGEILAKNKGNLKMYFVENKK